MKKEDIKIGEHYAIGEAAKRPAGKKDYSLRYIAQETGVERRILPSRSHYARHDYPTDGVLVQRVAEDGTPEKVHEVVRAAEIIRTWADYSEDADTFEQRRQEQQADQIAKWGEIRARLDAIIPRDEQPEVMQEFATARDDMGMLLFRWKVHVDLSMEQFTKVLEDAYRRGQEAKS